MKEKKKINRNNSLIKRKKKTKKLINADNPVNAIMDHTFIGKKIQKRALQHLFKDANMKRLKIDREIDE